VADDNGRDVTRLLARWAGGDSSALDALMPVVYAELRRRAQHYLRRERPGHTLQPTALVHEAWLRLVNLDRRTFEHRTHFFAVAANVMRRILVDHARAAHADKRGGGWVRIPLHDAAAAADSLVDLLALDRALEQLARVSARQAQVVELRYFTGLNVEEVAALLGVSPATISRDQRVAEAWLGHAMSEG
jgi:RNA polymerase sigma factor (TIGR02999 family)